MDCCWRAPGEALKALDNLERYYHDGSEPALVKCGLLHAQFETIHPFLDGNGRVGRLLISFFLHERRVLERPLLYLSYYFKKHRARYYDSLTAVRNEGDWEGWLKFFLAGVVEVAELAVSTARRLLELESADREKVRGISRSVRARDLHGLLLQRPLLGLTGVRQELGVSWETARSLVKAFEGQGMLREATGRKRHRLWVYEAYMDILKEGTLPPD